MKTERLCSVATQAVCTQSAYLATLNYSDHSDKLLSLCKPTQFHLLILMKRCTPNVYDNAVGETRLIHECSPLSTCFVEQTLRIM